MTSARGALEALDRAGIEYCVRNSPERVDAVPPGGDVDVVIAGGDVGPARETLLDAGWTPIAAPGHRGHHFFVAVDGGQWYKLDVITEVQTDAGRHPAASVLAGRVREDGVWVASEADRAAHDAWRRAQTGATRRRSLARARPAGVRRRGIVVALLGPDGAGKTTVLDAVVRAIPIGVTPVYLGTGRSGVPTSPAAVPASPIREVAFVGWKWLRSWRRLLPAYAAAWRGHVVLCDRHPIEIAAVRPERGRAAGAIEQLLFRRLLPRPDAVIVLDVPVEALAARKQEHDATVLERWRSGYAHAFPDAHVVRATGPVDETAAAVSGIVWDALRARLGA